MNERIRECMFNAGLNSNHVEGFDSIYSQQLEKFAQSIVENCAQAAEEYWNDAGLQRTFSPSEYIYTILEVEE